MSKASGKIDLHMHTTVSDGTDTPEELLANVRKAGLAVFSVTDHDAVKASGILRDLMTDGDPVFLSGVEFSCRDDQGKYHILGYGYDPDAEPILRVVETGHRFRMEKVRARLAFLEREYGIRFPDKEIRSLLSLDNPGKPHIGNLMVRYGFSESMEKAIKDFIDHIHFNNEFVSPEQAIRGILDAGGIPVLAHPAYGSGDQLILGDEMDGRLRRLMDFGLQGLEAFYSGFPAKLTRQMLDFAERYGLYVTAGSDYHGTNKLIPIGDTGLEDAADGPEGLQRFLRDVRRS